MSSTRRSDPMVFRLVLFILFALLSFAAIVPAISAQATNSIGALSENYRLDPSHRAEVPNLSINTKLLRCFGAPS